MKVLGQELGIVIMTAGDSGSAATGRQEIARIRYAEAQDAAVRLNVSAPMKPLKPTGGRDEGW